MPPPPSPHTPTHSQRPSCSSGEVKLCVRGLPLDSSLISEWEIRKIFKPYGPKGVELVRDRKSGVLRGYAYVTFHQYTDAKEAKTDLNGTKIGGLVVSIDICRDRALTPRYYAHQLRMRLSGSGPSGSSIRTASSPSTRPLTSSPSPHSARLSGSDPSGSSIRTASSSSTRPLTYSPSPHSARLSGSGPSGSSIGRASSSSSSSSSARRLTYSPSPPRPNHSARGIGPGEEEKNEKKRKEREKEKEKEGKKRKQ